jgi:hypothetical protein
MLSFLVLFVSIFPQKREKRERVERVERGESEV